MFEHFFTLYKEYNYEGPQYNSLLHLDKTYLMQYNK